VLPEALLEGLGESPLAGRIENAADIEGEDIRRGRAGSEDASALSGRQGPARELRDRGGCASARRSRARWMRWA